MQTIDLWGIIAWALCKELLHFIKLYSLSIDRHSQACRHKKTHTKRIFLQIWKPIFLKECQTREICEIKQQLKRNWELCLRRKKR